MNSRKKPLLQNERERRLGYRRQEGETPKWERDTCHFFPFHLGPHSTGTRNLSFFFFFFGGFGKQKNLKSSLLCKLAEKFTSPCALWMG